MWVVALVRDRVTEMQITPDKDKLLLLWFMSAVKGCIIQTSITNAILLCFILVTVQHGLKEFKEWLIST